MRTLEDVGKAVGLKPGEATSILAEVRQNNTLLNEGTRHQFQMPTDPQPHAAIGRRHTCVNCGGTLHGENIRDYERGVLHAGAPFKVWLDPKLPKD